MRIRYISDVHMEWMTPQQRADLVASVPTDCDVLVLAGDIDGPTSLQDMLKMFAHHFRHVVYVLGNHEFYGTSVDARLSTLHSWKKPANLHWLENSSVVIDGQRFVGCTMWFPKTRGAPAGVLADFVHIGRFVPWVYERNRESVAYLEQSVRHGDVVVTHHLPSQRCVAPKYAGHPTNAFYVCDVEPIIHARSPRLWIHGHTHETVDCIVGQTRIVANPYGYAGHETNARFNPAKTVDLDHDKPEPPRHIPPLAAWGSPAYYLVIDLEATTSEGGKELPPREMETIEIGAVLVRSSTLEVVDEFQSFVRPIRHPVLLPFCTKLTGIDQDMVNAAPLFGEAFAEMKRRLIAGRDGLVVWGSWGKFDAEQFQQDCALHHVHYDMPTHINLKDALSTAQGWRKSYGMTKALTRCGLTLQGAHHRGIDDARNVARLLPWIVGAQRTPWSK